MTTATSYPEENPGPSPTIEHAFDVLDRELNLDPRERIRAVKLHLEITTHLKKAGVIDNAILQGSVARKTALKPLRDIDKVGFLHPNHDGLQSSPGGADDAARLVEDVLRRAYPDALIERARHAIQLDFGEHTFSFDLVPAFECDDGTGDMMIMDLVSQTGPWKRSNTRTLIDVVAEKNQQCGGKFVHVVRMVKHWARQVFGEALPGLHVESIAFAVLSEVTSYGEAVSLVFEHGAALLGGSGYTDPTGDEHLSDKLDVGTREEVRRAFEGAAVKSTRALRLDANGRASEAIAAWHEIFGAPFPASSPSEKGFLAALGLGAPVNTGVRQPKPSTTPTRAWAP